MKVLVISLLRLGDILLHREVARALRRQHPGCEIHFLIYEQFQSVKTLLPEVDRWHHLDRKSLQRTLVERDQSPLSAFSELEQALMNLNAQKFDLILNATHNRFSVRMMDLLEAGEKRGVALEKGRKVPDQNSWQTYFNENFSEVGQSRFHYLEVLQRALGLDFSLPAKALSQRPGVIFLQLLTSDTKKNWGLQRFHALKNKIEKAFPEQKVLGLCSPQEKEQVSKVFHWNEFVTPDLDEARELLKEAQLLITGDTSLQHLAAQVGCPVVSLFLGSADPVKTAPWQMGAYVIQGQAACAPCAHSSPCHQSEHLCAQSISVSAVFDLVSGLLHRQAVSVLQTHAAETKSNHGAFSVVASGEPFKLRLEQRVWSAYLSGSNPMHEEALEDGGLEDIEALQKEHARFQSAVHKLIQKKLEIETIETEFPLWKDSLLRFKRDGRSIDETLKLIEIRSQVLARLRQQKEVSQHGSSRQYAQERFAQA